MRRQNFLISALLTKTTATQNEDALSYHRVRGLHFMAVIFVGSIICAKFITPTTITLHNLSPKLHAVPKNVTQNTF